MSNYKYPHIDTYHLIVYFYVASEKNITMAAEKLCLTQPTVTGHIKSLENSLGLKLIRITRKRVTLTPAGESIFTYAKEIYRQTIAAERFVEHLKDSVINLGSSPLFTSVMAKAITKMQNNASNLVKFNVRFGIYRDLVQDIMDSKLDLAIVPSLGLDHPMIHRIRISDAVRQIFFVSPEHPLLRKEYLTWEDITDYPLIIGQEEVWSAKKLISDKLFSEGVRKPLIINVSASTLEFCKFAIRDGKSISIGLKPDVEKELEEGQLCRLVLPDDLHVDVDAVIRRGYDASPITQSFISILKTSFPVE